MRIIRAPRARVKGLRLSEPARPATIPFPTPGTTYGGDMRVEMLLDVSVSGLFTVVLTFLPDGTPDVRVAPTLALAEVGS